MVIPFGTLTVGDLAAGGSYYYPWDNVNNRVSPLSKTSQREVVSSRNPLEVSVLLLGGEGAVEDASLAAQIGFRCPTCQGTCLVAVAYHRQSSEGGLQRGICRWLLMTCWT